VRRLLPPLFVCFYAIVAIEAARVGGREFYPFFNWSLFSYGTAHQVDITLRIKAIDGDELEPPRFIYEMKDRLEVAKKQDGMLFKVIDSFYLAIRKGDRDEANRLRAVIENRFLGDAGTMEYDLILIGFDPIERLRSGKIDETHVVESYSKTPK
jgi:hypothetical protein